MVEDTFLFTSQWRNSSWGIEDGGHCYLETGTGWSFCSDDDGCCFRARTYWWNIIVSLRLRLQFEFPIGPIVGMYLSIHSSDSNSTGRELYATLDGSSVILSTATCLLHDDGGRPRSGEHPSAFPAGLLESQDMISQRRNLPWLYLSPATGSMGDPPRIGLRTWI